MAPGPGPITTLMGLMTAMQVVEATATTATLQKPNLATRLQHRHLPTRTTCAEGDPGGVAREITVTTAAVATKVTLVTGTTTWPPPTLPTRPPLRTTPTSMLQHAYICMPSRHL